MAAGIAWRVGAIIVNNPMDALYSDAGGYWNDAASPLGESPFPAYNGSAIYLWLSAVQRLSAGIPGLVAWYTLLLSCVTPIIWYLVVKEIIGRERRVLRLWIGAALFLWPSWIAIYSYFMTETLAIPLFGLALYQSLRAARKRTTADIGLMTLAWIAACLARSVFIPCAAVACLMVWITSPGKKFTAMLASGILVFFLVPLSIRNHSACGSYMPTGNAAFNSRYAESGSRKVVIHFRKGLDMQWDYEFMCPSCIDGANPFAPFWEWRSARNGTVELERDISNDTWVERRYSPGASNPTRLRLENILWG